MWIDCWLHNLKYSYFRVLVICQIPLVSNILSMSQLYPVNMYRLTVNAVSQISHNFGMLPTLLCDNEFQIRNILCHWVPHTYLLINSVRKNETKNSEYFFACVYSGNFFVTIIIVEIISSSIITSSWISTASALGVYKSYT